MPLGPKGLMRFALLIVALVAFAGAAACAQAKSVTRVFGFTGQQQKFKVPRGVRRLHVVTVGGRGGSAGAAQGGLKVAKASADFPVHPGEVLYVEVGGNGQDAGGDPGWNGGGPASTSDAGNGGGVSDLRTVSRPKSDSARSLASRLIVAGGSGGAGGPGVFVIGGAGGNAGGRYGHNGQGGAGSGAGFGGIGGGEIGGGDGGTSPAGYPGTPGLFGAGGQGADGGDGAAGGGGGGGGWFGGGGGGASVVGSDHGSAGGGGGGSSFFAAQTRHRSLTLVDGGIPIIKLTYSR